MRHHSFFPILSSMLLLANAALLTTSCEYRDIISEHEFQRYVDEDTSCTYILDIDWTDMDQDPSGMTVLFYPSDGRMPYIRLSNEVHHYEVTLPQDTYKVLVFNQSVDEFPYLTFSGFDMFETATAMAATSDDDRSRIDRLYDLPRNYGNNTSQNSNSRAQTTLSQLRVKGIGSASNTMSAPSVGRPSGTPQASPTRAQTTLSQLRVKPGLNQMTINVRVRDLTCSEISGLSPVVVAVNGALTGLAPGYHMATMEVADGSLTQELDTWDINATNQQGSVGTVTCTFGQFGISNSVTGQSSATPVAPAPAIMNAESYVEASPEDDTENILYLNFRLLNGTYVPFRFVVTDRIREQRDKGYLELTLDIGIALDGTILDEPIILPEEGLPYGGMQIQVKDWAEPTDATIILE